MTVKDVFELRSAGRTEEAYEAIRQIYAVDKGRYATVCMFWTALDVLRLRTKEGRIETARLIYCALERVLERMDDSDGKARSALAAARRRLDVAAASTALAPEAFHAQLGRWGEEVAAEYLRAKGYVVVERDWHSSHRDLDIVAMDGDTLVFVEVKTRSTTDYGDPEEAVGYWKQRNLQRSINHYLSYCQADGPWRFDVITVVGAIGATPVINHIKDFALLAR